MKVNIIPLGEVKTSLIETAVEGLESVYECEVSLARPQSVPDEAYDEDRDQYRAEELLEHVRGTHSEGVDLALTPVDMYHMEKGRATMYSLGMADHSAAVVPIYRLEPSKPSKPTLFGRLFRVLMRSPTNTGLEQSEDRFYDRVRKQSVKMVGISEGIRYCDNPSCVMRFSLGVREVDEKDLLPCEECQEDLDFKKQMSEVPVNAE